MPLQVENLSMRVGNAWTLKDVAFEAADGEVFGIFGATAAGKTTLLSCIAGKSKPTSGTITIGSLPCKEGDVRFVETWKPPSARIFGRKRIELSDGEGHIVHFRENLKGPENITLFDEPFAGIDASFHAELFDELRGVAARGRIVLFASSDFEQIAAVCDRAAVIVKGEIEQIGAPREVYEGPASVSVASAVGVKNLLIARRLTSTNAAMPEFITIEGNHRLFAHPTEAAKLGAINQNVTLAVHPEQLSISFGASFPEDNLLRAIVTGIHFLGATTMVDLDAEGLKLQARVFRVVGLNVGDECMIAIPPDRIQVLRS